MRERPHFQGRGQRTSYGTTVECIATSVNPPHLHLKDPSSDRFVLLRSTSSTFSFTPIFPFHSLSNHCWTSFSVGAKLPLSPVSPFTTFPTIFSEGRAKPACGYSVYAERSEGAVVSFTALAAEGVEKKILRICSWEMSCKVEGDHAARSFLFSLSRCVTPVTKSGAMSGF